MERRKGVTMKALALCIALVCLNVSCAALSQESGSGPKQSEQSGKRSEDELCSKKTEKEVIRRAKRIRRELKKLKEHPWAGVYVQRGVSFGGGERFESVLAVSPKNGFLLDSSELLDDIGGFDGNFGTVRADGNMLRFCFEFPHEFCFSGDLSSKMIRVKWGERRYLIAEEDMLQFCNSVNSGQELDFNRIKTDSFFVRREDTGKKASGIPELPAKYRRLILKKRLVTTVLAVSEGTQKPGNGLDSARIVTLNVGTNDGVYPGLRLYFWEPRVYGAAMEVKTASTSECRAVVGCEIGEDIESASPDFVPKKGWVLCSRHSDCGESLDEGEGK